jgi:hypothetical protein
MEKINVLRSLQSFVVLPILATNLLGAPMEFQKIPTVAVLSTDENGLLSPKLSDNQQSDVEEKAQKIDAYFAKYNLPLAGHGETFVNVAEKYGLPWNFLPSIAMAESTGCKFIIPKTNNCFGWGSGKIKFESIDESIEVIAQNLSGNDPDTAHHYADKDIDGILKTYNPPRVAPKYLGIVKSIMKSIENTNLE